MRKTLVSIALLWPLIAHAEGGFPLVNLAEWYVLLVICMVAFLAFSSAKRDRKAGAAMGFFLTPAISLLIAFQFPNSAVAWHESARWTILALAPIVGFCWGYYASKPKADES